MLAVHYRHQLIEDYFGDGDRLGVRIKYIRETEPLGTAGALREVRTDQSFIVSNADIIADVDYTDLLRVHAVSGKDATACLGLHQQQIPFGVAEVREDGTLTVREKPIENFNVLAGIYVLPEWAPSTVQGPTDMPDLLARMKVGTYAIRGFWMDVGHFESLAIAHFDWSLRLARPAA